MSGLQPMMRGVCRIGSLAQAPVARGCGLSAFSSPVPSYRGPRVCARRVCAAPVWSQMLSRVPSTHFSSAVSANSIRSTIAKLMDQVGSRKEVEIYLKRFSKVSRRFAVIKVGGGILADEMEVLVESLTFLHNVGLHPVVIHGAGPQLNAELAKKGIESDYIGGLRVTTGDILYTARKVFLRENLRLVESLAKAGTSARSIVSGVFEAEPLDEQKFGYVGQLTQVDPEHVYNAIDAGHMPVLTCMGESKTGQILNINADIAGRELARAIVPEKIVYLSQAGGLRDDKNNLIKSIDLNEDYDRLMNADWFKHGSRLKLKEIKELLDLLPPTSSVAITSAVNLPRELFTHRGMGTLVRRHDRVRKHTSIADVDEDALVKVVEEAFDGTLDDGFLAKVEKDVKAIYVVEDYLACAIVVQSPSDPVPYLSKFVVSQAAQNDGKAQLLWRAIRKDFSSLFLRSRNTNRINDWYFKGTDGSARAGPWRVFWYGVDIKEAPALIEAASARAPEITYRAGTPQAAQSVASGRDTPSSSFSTRAAAAPSSSASRMQPQPFTARFPFAGKGVSSTLTRVHSWAQHGRMAAHGRCFGSSAVPGARRVGLVGARGYTGAEVLRIIDAHPSLTLTVASSRALVGQQIQEVIKGVQSDFATLEFCDLQPNQVHEHPDVDVWILAMPNKLAQPFVDAVDQTNAEAKVVDLSADYRFNDNWTYGLPERKGAREKLVDATRVANPGCYATGAQLSLFPLAEAGLIQEGHPPHIFGVSGYSGAGTTPSRKNDVQELKDNLMPYSLTGHIHEREVSRQLAQHVGSGVRFMPHVASWFRGIALTVAVQLSDTSLTREHIVDMYKNYYQGEPLVLVHDDIPEVVHNAGSHHAAVGGFVLEPSTGRLVVTSTLDNLLKGAATQCIQNINIMLGVPELSGIRDE